MFRPEGWDNPCPQVQMTYYEQQRELAFEAGADAMYEGIMQFGHYKVDWSDNGWDIPKVHRGKKGYLVFIPEVKE